MIHTEIPLDFQPFILINPDFRDKCISRFLCQFLNMQIPKQVFPILPGLSAFLLQYRKLSRCLLFLY